MSALVETIFYESNEANGRFVPWHGLGEAVETAPTSEEAIKLAGLDWIVEKKPIFDADGNKIENYFANTRDKDKSVLGIVSGRYEIVQNKDAFAFTDSLIDEGMTYATAGSLKGGKCIWLLGKMPKKKILDDDIEPFVAFTNTFDGSGAVQAIMTPVRICCANTLNFALNSAKRKWSTRHIGDIQSKLYEAKVTLGLIDAYMQSLDEDMTKLADAKISDAEVEAMLDLIYPVKEDDSDIRKKRIDNLKSGFFHCLDAADIRQYKNTKFAVAMAATDYADHAEPMRKTSNFEENRWYQVMQGHPFVDSIYKQLAA